jgi:hypothetical protein
MPTRCFLLEPTDMVRRALRRYTEKHTGGWTCAEGWHEAQVPFDDAPAIWEERVDNAGWKHRVVDHRRSDKPADDDPRWPVMCAKCPFVFAPDAVRQFFYDLLYRGVGTGALYTLRDAPPGAMWNAWWLQDLLPGGVIPGPSPDGLMLMVKCPNGREWFIDGRASNCTMPKDDNHNCWVRHGTPPDLVVDKNGRSCSAGAGSIVAGDYHGFLGAGGAPPGVFT